jgi:hypothetical protein
MISAHRHFGYKNQSRGTIASYGIGNCACLTGAVFSVISFTLFLIDFNMPGHAKRLSAPQRSYVFANMLFVLYTAFGSFIFHFLEGWDFGTASYFWFLFKLIFIA